MTLCVRVCTCACACDLGKVPLEESGMDMEKQLEGNEWQLKILREVQAASGNQERAELLKGYSLKEFCALVQSISDKVKIIQI